jgi:hypothetical protein
MRITVTIALVVAGMFRPGAGLPAQTVPAPASASVLLSADLPGELRNGRTVLRGIGWAPAAGELKEGAGVAFSDAIATLALAIRQAGGSYRADFYVEPRADKATAQRVAAGRFAAVRDALSHAGLPDDAVVPGTVAVDKDARLELVRTGP